MKPNDILTENKPPHIVIYSTFGKGKTGLASQAFNGYCFDFDNGMRTAALLQKIDGINRQIEFDLYLDMNVKMPTAFAKFKSKLLEFNSQIRAGKFPFDAIVVDSWTGCCQSCERQIKSTAPGRDKQGNVILSQHDWGLIVDELEQILDLLRGLPVMVILVAHAKTIEKDGMNVYTPYSSGQKIPVILPTYFDEVWNLKAVKKGADQYEYIVTGRATETLDARTRSNIGTVVHAHEPPQKDDLGLKGLLKLMGFNYPPLKGTDDNANKNQS